ncbi:MAG TPA: SufS family cysteine desulfurase [Solirubrobacteraceae bacterium]|nr:SufS family cysteine desulfurase [Solirubrobacteraceae bacterium]
MTALAGPHLDVRGEFPVLEREGLAYLDSAATSQKPLAVIEAMDDLLRHHNASIHRGVYPLAVEATDRFEGARQRAAAWLGSTVRETVFTKNATEAINLVAQSWGRTNLRAGDLVVLTQMEHHSSIVPWQLACQASGAELAFVPIDEQGELVLGALDSLLERRPKVVGVVHVSNVLGTVNPVEEIVRRAHAAGAMVLVDGTQAVPQVPVDLRAIDADFYVWTAHKAYGPTGLGILHGRRELLEAMPPFLGGGHMISSVDWHESRWAELPAKFEAGTSPIAEAVGMGAAVGWIQQLGIGRIRAHEAELVAYALERLADMPGVRVFGPPAAERRGAVISFAVDGVHPHDVAEILGRTGVCVRAGHHCAQPLMRVLGVPATTRASFAAHTTREEIDQLVGGLERVREVFA